jgi:Tfp pilus assembly protein PilW
MKFSRKKNHAAFTMVEMMMSMGCGSIILAAVVMAGVSLQRSFAAVESYATAEGDQLRVLDYIAMDCRRATSASVSNNILTLTIPEYYQSSGTPYDPVFSSTVNTVQYHKDSNGNTTYYTIQYYQSGSRFVRQVGPTSGWPTGSTTTAIATNVATFTVTPQDITTTVSCSIFFFPTFTRMAGSGTWRSGSSAPASGVGNNGDYYVIDTTASDLSTVGNVYLKSNGSYALLQNIKATQVYCNTFLRNAVARQ